MLASIGQWNGDKLKNENTKVQIFKITPKDNVKEIWKFETKQVIQGRK